MIPQETIEQVAAANDVVDVIGNSVPLKRAGSVYKALCPFHKEKSPSFVVNPARQSFKCFGCNVGGTVFKFIELYENLSFPAAVRRLAEKAGIPIIEEGGYGGTRDDDKGAGETRRRLLALHAEVTEWFHRNLRKSNEAAIAREYLKSRGLTSEVAGRWQLGYAPDSWDACMHWASNKGYSQDLLILSGLVKARDEDSDGGNQGNSSRQQRGYDRFRDRLMFPICNELGEVIAFSGRVLTSDAKGAKYVNSPETPLFTKGKILFGLHLSKRSIIEEGFAIVCEGQIDLITAYEAGIKNVVAPQGTAFTDRQARLLKRHADEVVLCFDADNAGQQAAEKSLPALLEANVTVRVATMPPGEDPDSLIRNHGVEAFAERIGMAQDFFDFQIDRLSQMINMDTPKGKNQFAKRMAETVKMITDKVLRESVIGKVSVRLGTTSQVFKTLLDQSHASEKRQSLPPDLTGLSQPSSVDDQPSFEAPSKAVSHLLRLALESSVALNWIMDQSWQEVLPKLSGTELLIAVLNANLDPTDVGSINAYLATLPPSEEAFLTGLLSDPPFAKPMIVAHDSWVSLESSVINDRITTLMSRATSADAKEDSTRIGKEILDLRRRLNDIARP